MILSARGFVGIASCSVGNDRKSIEYLFMSPNASLLLINNLYCVSNTVLISLLF